MKSGRRAVELVWLLLAAALVGALSLGAMAASRPQGATKLHFTSAGKDIEVEFFQPSTLPYKTSVVLLHGAGGTLFDGPDLRRTASYLAEAGHPAYFIHYFDRTGTVAAVDSTMREHFDEWLPTVRDAISWVHAQPAAGNRRVAIYGYSLGAFLSLAASSGNHELCAVVEQAGGIWYGQRERLHDLPATLEVHGRDDQRVPFEKFAVPLAALLRERNVFVQTSYYPGEGHRFTQPNEEKVRAQIVSFIESHARH